MVQGMVELFYPFVEGAIHDLKSGTIAAIFNNLSQRKVGDPTPLKELNVKTEQFPDYFPPYYKTNWDGKRLKCISFTVRDSNGTAIGLVCFNLDISLFQDLESKFSALLQLTQPSENPIDLFGDNWQDQVHAHIEHFLKDHKLTLGRLSRINKKELIVSLYNKGIFNFKNAAPFVADILKISRASLYNYMKEV